MDQERNLGVTEARFGLTVLICLLVAIGYIVLLRLGNSGELPVEIRPGGESSGPIARDTPTPGNDHQPLVLPIEPEGTSVPYTSLRPDQPAPPIQRRGADEASEPQRR